MKTRLSVFYCIAAVVLLSACAGPSLRQEVIRSEATYAKPPAAEGIIADMANAITAEFGTEHSGPGMFQRHPSVDIHRNR